MANERYEDFGEWLVTLSNGRQVMRDFARCRDCGALLYHDYDSRMLHDRFHDARGQSWVSPLDPGLVLPADEKRDAE